MLNPFRSDIEQILFPNDEAVDDFFRLMDEALGVALDVEQAPDVIQRNKDYLASCLLFESIRDSGHDLTPYQLS